uniref:Major capsid protein n=1 Tax=Rhabditophanes sp. KR3021 TaxID=114890 RepID=A0AC35TQT9_9BILA
MSGTKVKTLGPNEAPTAAFATNEYVLFRRPPVANALNFKVVRLTNEEKLPVTLTETVYYTFKKGTGENKYTFVFALFCPWRSYMLNNVAATMSQFYLYVPNIPTNHATINHRTAVSVIGLPSDISNLNFLSIYSHTTKSYPALSPMPVIPVLYTTLNQKNAGFKYEDYPKLYNPPNYNYIDWAIKVKPDVANEHPFYSTTFTCNELKSRVYLPPRPRTTLEASYSIGYTVTAQGGLRHFESNFASIWSPNNVYCIVASTDVSEPIRNNVFLQWPICFPNVKLMTPDWDKVDQNYNGVNVGQYNCLKYLKDQKVEYVISLKSNNHFIKSNKEIIQMVISLNGSVAAEFKDFAPAGRFDPITSHNEKQDWTHGGLNIFRAGDPRLTDETIMKAKFPLFRSYDAFALPIASLKYIMDTLNLDTFMENLQNREELYPNLFPNNMFGSVFGNGYIEIPGAYHHTCLTKYPNSFPIISYQTYKDHIYPCISSWTKVDGCVVTAETIWKVYDNPAIQVGPVFYQDDVTSVYGIERMVYDRQNSNYEYDLDTTFYQTNPIVRYQKVAKDASMTQAQKCDYAADMSS